MFNWENKIGSGAEVKIRFGMFHVFVSLDAAFYYIIFYHLLERFNYKPVSPRSAFLENWKSARSLLECLTEDIKKELVRVRD